MECDIKSKNKFPLQIIWKFFYFEVLTLCQKILQLNRIEWDFLNPKIIILFLRYKQSVLYKNLDNLNLVKFLLWWFGLEPILVIAKASSKSRSPLEWSKATKKQSS